MSGTYVIGVGQSAFGKHPSATVRTLAEKAVNLALLDAGLTLRDLQAVFFANSFWGHFAGQHCIRGQVVVRGMGLDRVPVTNVENACAGGATALHSAYTAVRAGLYDVVLAVGAEKMTAPDRATTLSGLRGGTDREGLDLHLRTLSGLARGVDAAGSEGGREPRADRSVFVDLYAAFARWHMEKYGTTREQLARIAAKNHCHGALNPRSQYQSARTVDQVLAEPPIVYPLSRSMCAPIGDGASAAVVCSEAVLARLGAARPVRILASVLGQGSDRGLDGEDLGARLGRQAYEASGLGPEDVDLAELHDAAASCELRQLESLGFCPEGEGGIFSESGATALGGRLPVNTSGGLESRGHPIAASGLAQVHEIVTQLRGQGGRRQVPGARIGLTESGGGNIGVEEAVMCIHVFQANGR